MLILVFLLLLSLTFLFTILMKTVGFLYKKRINIPEIIRQNIVYLWFPIIIVAGLMGRGAFNIALPNGALNIKAMDWLYIILVLYLFCVYSSYRVSKTLKEFIIFSLVFPIGEEILFRGIIQSVAKQFLLLDNKYVNLPLFGSVPVIVLISAVCFGITHFQYHNYSINRLSLKQVLMATVFGIFAGNIVELTGSILYPVLFHIAANTGTVLYGKYVRRNMDAVKI